MGDLDILVRPEQITATIQRCKALGYDQSIPPTGPMIQRTLEFHTHLFGEQQCPADVEVHHSLVTAPGHPYAPNLAWFWSQIEPLPTCPEINWLAPTGQLLHLAAHMVLQHGEAYMTLIKYYDVHALIAHYGTRIDWDDLAQQVAVWGWNGVLDAAMQAVTLRFQTPWPGREQQVGDRGAQRSAIQSTAASLVVEQRSQKISSIPLGHLGIGIGTLPWPDRVAVIWESLVPTPTYMRWRYRLRPAWLWPLAYFVRWFNGVRDTIRLIGMWFERDRSP